ncbi:hypothetical protein R3P38DRAFT_3202029 [Favolaschia claudopus]|uniref:Uncharacterized protein n=1 Tax=Favolaschia claudopus TaxID=2862362 RepID=A0AAW0AV92_9AGAR
MPFFPLLWRSLPYHLELRLEWLSFLLATTIGDLPMQDMSSPPSFARPPVHSRSMHRWPPCMNLKLLLSHPQRVSSRTPLKDWILLAYRYVKLALASLLRDRNSRRHGGILAKTNDDSISISAAYNPPPPVLPPALPLDAPLFLISRITDSCVYPSPFLLPPHSDLLPILAASTNTPLHKDAADG